MESLGYVYNEIDPYAAQWLRNLGAEIVLEKSIVDLEPRDVESAGRFHAFAGIGLWEHALRLAGWPLSAPVWTGSCPCQPFSVAGKRKGAADARHLWPDWFRIIEECRPPVIFGEQVASPDGRNWLDAISLDLEALGYAVGAADLCAAGVGAPHRRQRLFWVGYTNGERLQGRGQRGGGSDQRAIGSNGMVNGFWATAEWVPCSDGPSRPAQPGTFPLAYGDPSRVGKLRAYGNAIVPQVAATFIESVMDVIL